MFSVLRKGLLYKDISKDVVEHDNDIDADQWEYDGKDVYRGSVDPRYVEYNLKVYWLYDDNLNKVGLAEHESDNPAEFKALWIYDNPFATLYQNPEWTSKGKTIWSMISEQAYQDCLQEDFESVFDRCLSSKYRLVTPEFLIEPPTIYECKKCGVKSLYTSSCCKDIVEIPYFPHDYLLFVDDSFIIYNPPIKHSPLPDVSVQEHLEQPLVQLSEVESQDVLPEPKLVD
jgi:hypothetical protein